MQPFFLKTSRGEKCVLLVEAGAPELHELISRAKQSESWDEFSNEFLNDTWREHFDVLCAAWDHPAPERAWASLRLMEVRSVDEQGLVELVEARITPLIEGNPDLAAATLGQLAEDSVLVTLTVDSIWKSLDASGLRCRRWADDASLVERVQGQPSAFMEQAGWLRIDHQAIPRDETGQAVDALQKGEDVLLVGGAGYGKSEVIAQTLAVITDLHWPVLIVRADRVAGSTTDLGAAMGLPGRPVSVLAALAPDQPSMLVIDQLDAVGFASGRNSGHFDVVADLLAEASSHAGLRVLLACRTFDMDHDYRLRSLVESRKPSVVAVGPMGADVVASVLERVGADATRILDNVRKLLVVPFHLALYVDLIHRQAPQLSAVATEDQLLSIYWDEKRAQCRDVRGGTDQWIEVVNRMCDLMSERQELFVPRAALDEFEKQANAMESAGVLAEDGERVAFFHERFFDYCYARQFAARNRGRGISALLDGDEQDLFRRAQVRQVLLYERAADPSRYVEDLKWLLGDSRVRPHIVAAAIAVVGAVEDPRPEEWDVLRALADDTDDWRHARVWWAIRRNASWLPVIDARGDWERWLKGDKQRVDLAVGALVAAAPAHPERAADLLEGHLGRERAGQLLSTLLARARDRSSGRGAIDLALRILDNDDSGQAHGADLWFLVGELAKTNASLACEVIERQLLGLIRDPKGVGNPQALDHFPDMGLAREALMTAAQGCPADFVERLLPIMLSLMAANATKDGGERAVPVPDALWSHHHYRASHRIADGLYTAMEEALRLLVSIGPSSAASTAMDALKTAPWESAQFLAARAYLGDPTRLADDAAAWLCDSEARLAFGYLDSPYWVSRELIAAISPHCSPAALERLSDLLLSYTPDWEKRPEARRWRGSAQLCLLSGLDATRRSPQVKHRLGELQRKLDRLDEAPPAGAVGGLVVSPIEPSQASHMSDDQWLGAMRQHAKELGDLLANGALRGGAHELSRVLEGETQRDPDRFAGLILRIGPDVKDVYPAAILRGLSEATIDGATLERVALHAADLKSSEVNRWLVRLIMDHAHDDLGDSVLDTVAWVAGNDANPSEDIWREPATGGVAYYGGDIDFAGINTTRGAAALALAQLVAVSPARFDRLKPAIAQLTVDPILSVRACAVAALGASLKIDPAFALEAFSAAVRDEDELLRSDQVRRFLFTAQREHWGAIEETVERMLSSSDDAVARSGAQALCLASYSRPGLDARIDQCLSGSESQRLGVIDVLADMLPVEDRRDRYISVVAVALDDEHESVRREASRAFFGLKGSPLEPYRQLFEAFARSRALGDSAYSALQALEGAVERLPETALVLCERFVELHGSTAGDIRTAAAGDVGQVTQILLRLRTQSSDQSQRTRCLDLVDVLIRQGAVGIDDSLTSLDR